MIKRKMYLCLADFLFFCRLLFLAFINLLMRLSNNVNFIKKCRESFLQDFVLWLDRKERKAEYAAFTTALAYAGISYETFVGIMIGVLKKEEKIFFEGWSNDS